jgi:hypothetical protein
MLPSLVLLLDDDSAKFLPTVSMPLFVGFPLSDPLLLIVKVMNSSPSSSQTRSFH